MGNIDALSKRFMRHSDVFAEYHDLLFKLNDIELTVDRDSLTEQDSDVTVSLSGQLKQYMERCNDVVRLASVSRNGKSRPVIFCLENQAYVRYDQAVQNSVSTALRLEFEVQKLHNQHEQEKIQKEISGENTSVNAPRLPMQRITRSDRLPIIVHSVFYLGGDIWNASDSLQDLCDVGFEEMKKLMMQCPVNVVVPMAIAINLILGLKTELRALLLVLHFINEPESLLYYFKTDPMMKHLSYDAIRLIAALTHINLEPSKKQETYDMSKVGIDLVGYITRREHEKAQQYAEQLAVQLAEEERRKMELRAEEERRKMEQLAEQRAEEERRKMEQRAEEERRKMEQRAEEERRKMEQLAEQDRLDWIGRMLSIGISIDNISAVTKLPLAKLHEIIASLAPEAAPLNPSHGD